MWWFALLALVACAPETERAKEIVPGAATAHQALPELQGKVRPLEKGYEIDLQWKAPGWAAEHWWIQRHSPRSQSTLARLEGSADRFSDATAEMGIAYRYGLYAEVQGVLSEVASAEVSVPRDWVYATGKQLAAAGTYGRVFLEEGAVVLTGDQDFELKADAIYSEGGRFESYPENQRAPAGDAGRKAGKITLQAKRFKGVLHVVSRGERGGNGVPGAEGKIGSRGRNGREAHFDIGVMRPAPGENGFPGGRGGPGSTGGAGGRGGDGGAVHLVLDHVEGYVHPTSLGGAGGAAGKGGAGGKGGPGGSGGKMPSTAQVRVAEGVDGEVGPTGAPGADGQAGAAGVSGEVCLQLADKVILGTCAPVRIDHP
ncbi:hypothetical protein K2X33_14020 [bacterium]|nr:hypothetical protein [bacterium]